MSFFCNQDTRNLTASNQSFRPARPEPLQKSGVEQSRQGPNQMSRSNVDHLRSPADNLNSPQTNIAHSQLDNFAGNKKVPKLACAYHPEHTITNFCKDPKCLMPLCPECVRIHTTEHKNFGNYADFDTLENTVTQAADQLSQAIRENLEIKAKFDDFKNVKGQLPVKLRDHLADAKARVQEAINDYFDNLAKDISDNIHAQGRDIDEQLSDSEQTIKSRQNMLEKYRQRLYSQKCLKYLIKLLQNDLVTGSRVHNLEVDRRVSELQKKLLIVNFDENLLTEIQGLLDRYIHVGDGTITHHTAPVQQTAIPVTSVRMPTIQSQYPVVESVIHPVVQSQSQQITQTQPLQAIKTQLPQIIQTQPLQVIKTQEPTQIQLSPARDTIVNPHFVNQPPPGSIIHPPLNLPSHMDSILHQPLDLPSREPAFSSHLSPISNLLSDLKVPPLEIRKDASHVIPLYNPSFQSPDVRPNRFESSQLYQDNPIRVQNPTFVDKPITLENLPLRTEVEHTLRSQSPAPTRSGVISGSNLINNSASNNLVNMSTPPRQSQTIIMPVQGGPPRPIIGNGIISTVIHQGPLGSFNPDLAISLRGGNKVTSSLSPQKVNTSHGSAQRLTRSPENPNKIIVTKDLEDPCHVCKKIITNEPYVESHAQYVEEPRRNNYVLENIEERSQSSMADSKNEAAQHKLFNRVQNFPSSTLKQEFDRAIKDTRHNKFQQ